MNNLKTNIKEKPSIEDNYDIYVKKYNDFFNNESFYKYESISDADLREFKNDLNWYYIGKYQNLSESTIREHLHMFDWRILAEYQNLSENFIREFQNNLDWHIISMHQKLSEKFIREFSNKISWDGLFCNPNYERIGDYEITAFGKKISPEKCTAFTNEFNLWDWWD